MSVAIQLVCEECGRRTREVVTSGAIPRETVERLRREAHDQSNWERVRRVADTTRDLCGGCAGVLLERARGGKGAKR